MSFNREIEKARDQRLPTSRRYVALRSAVTLFSPNGFSNTFANLASRVGVPGADDRWTDVQIMQAAGLLTQSRDHYLVSRQRWDDERRKNKANGARFATKLQLDARASSSWFDSVASGTKHRYTWVSLAEWVTRQELTLAPFGPELASDLRIVRDAMPSATFQMANQIVAHYGPFPSLWEPANIIGIPSRIYESPIPKSTYQSLSPTQQSIADCLYSRSSDGYTRQRHLRRIVATEELWVIPYVVAALGDYVVEVVKEVAAGLTELDDARSWQARKYRLFAEHNPDLIQLVRQRSSSYWNCYYSHAFTMGGGTEQRPRYPSLGVIHSIGMHGHRGLYRSS